MFSNIFLKSFRILLLPFALIYWLIIAVINFLYDKKIMRSTSFNIPVICVGNLAVGGTGKSPMVEYLLQQLTSKFRVATLSRGYKRKTRGYALAQENSTALDIGDEPMQFHLKFPDIPVAVGEERVVAIPQLLHDRPKTEVIILDDAFQHRSIAAGFNILLTEYNNLFTSDFYLPTGDLRDLKSNYKKAQVIVVTKCPPTLRTEEKESIRKEIRLKPHQHLFFTSIEYGTIYHLVNKQQFRPSPDTEVLLVTGIANPRHLKSLMEEHFTSYSLVQYADHHIFTIDDLREMLKSYKAIEARNKIILTTEKDAVRLVKFEQEIRNLPFYVIPIRHHFLFGEAGKFNELVEAFILQFQQQTRN